MYSYEGNIVNINGIKLMFKYSVRDMLKYKEKYIILLEIPYDKDDINNIYCLNENTKLIWKVEDLDKLYPERRNMPYEQIAVENNILYASDFAGRCYHIDIDNGCIIGCNINR